MRAEIGSAVAGVVLASSLLSAGSAAATNLTGNSYFPLAVGAKWTYDYTSGAEAGTSYSLSVLSDHKAASGKAVNVQIATSTGTTVTLEYLIQPNGSIEVQVGAPGGAKTTITSSGNYFIPSASQIPNCHPCQFGATVKATFPGSPISVTEQVKEKVTTLGTAMVKVPAGSFSTEKLHLLLAITGGGKGFSLHETVGYSMYLAKGFGLVQTSSGTATSTVLGHSISTATPSAVLTKFTA